MTQQPPFLARKTFGTPNYFWIALGFALFVAFIPRAVREALKSNTNKAEDWLPDSYAESADLSWFRGHFVSEGFVLVSWEGCTLGNPEQLNLLREKLSPRVQGDVTPLADSLRERVERRTGKWFRKIITGPSMLEELTQSPSNLSYAEAVRRLEGALLGPPARDAEGNLQEDATRTTCLVAFLAPEGYETNLAMRRVIDEIARVAEQECNIPAAQFHMGGPTVDNVAIDRAGEGSLMRLVGLSGIVGLTVSFWCFRNMKLTGVVVAVGAVSASMSLAAVFYYGVIEVFFGGRSAPKYGTMDAVLMSMPAVVYVLGLSGAIHLVNYYRDSRLKHGIDGSVERAVRTAWTPCALASFTTAVGLGSLAVSDIVPIKKFGGFTALAVLGALGVLFTLVPVYLHRFPPKRIGRRSWEEAAQSAVLPDWVNSFTRFLTTRYALVSIVGIAGMLLIGFGMTKLDSSIRLLKLLDEKSDLIQDYTWLEKNMGYLVPMEIVLTVPPERCRSGDEHAEQDSTQYRMTMLERLDMVRHVLARIESLDGVSRTLSAATFAPDGSENTSEALRRGNDYTTNKNLEKNRHAFRDYLQMERLEGMQAGAESRELWRISARVTALQDIDYGRFVEELREEVEPILLAYNQRDQLLQELHESGKKLEGARLCVLYDGNTNERQPASGSPEEMLQTLLRESGVRQRVDGKKGSLASYNLAQLNNPEMTVEEQTKVVEALRTQDAVLFLSEGGNATVEQLATQGVPIIRLMTKSLDRGNPTIAADRTSGPRPIRALYTGIIPLVFKTQRELLVSLRESIAWATVLIAVVMSIVLRSPAAGLVSMIPNVFPLVLVFGSLGWMGIKIDIGIMMTASVALGVAVDDTVHFLTWFRHGLRKGLDRRGATLLAYDRCAIAMVQTTLIAGLGLVVFAASPFMPTKQFGSLMIAMLAAALVGDLIFLPSILCGPLGWFFEKKRERADVPVDLSPSQEVITAKDMPVVPEVEELTSPTNSELRSKLRSFRRSSAHDSLDPR